MTAACLNVSSLGNSPQESATVVASSSFSDTLRVVLKNSDINRDTWKETALHRKIWHSPFQKGATHYEGNRLDKAQRKKEECKQGLTDATLATGNLFSNCVADNAGPA